MKIEIPNQNVYGNVNIIKGLPEFCVHIANDYNCHVNAIAKRLQIPYASALVGWSRSGRWIRPIIDGIVIREVDEEVFRIEFAKVVAKKIIKNQKCEARHIIVARQIDKSTAAIKLAEWFTKLKTAPKDSNRRAKLHKKINRTLREFPELKIAM